MILKFNYKGKKIIVEPIEVCDGWKKITGLIFSRREKAKAKLFRFSKPTDLAIHSWFVFFPFVAVWMDKNEKVISIERIRPFTLQSRPKKQFTALLEIPENATYKKICDGLLSSSES